MIESIATNGCLITTIPPALPNTMVIVVDWIGFSMVNDYTRIEMLLDDILTVWHVSSHTVIKQAPEKLDQETIERMKGG